MKYDLIIKNINRYDATEFVQTWHYSKVMPKLTKHFLGIYNEDIMVGVLTLGWGTQPLHTIKKLFQDCTSIDYYEIGKMCMHPDMPKNSESQMLSAVIKWMKINTPEKKYLFTWADGIVGKPGYVYQAANFFYGGFIWTDIYIGPDGEKIHPRSSRQLCIENGKLLGREKVFWLTDEFMKMKGIRRVKGKQFRYIMPLNKKLLKNLNKNSTVKWGLDYPKHKDLIWREKNSEGKYIPTSDMPNFDMGVINVNSKNVNSHKQGDSLYKFFE
ncbi:hypothetical protein UFOVP1655_190 [uncultured Caudovirales phage]|uniref:Uncharacterized protein n=1 Tax=uncultured Caudovirales phage TaxID=2100421 RepID=A0A6J5T4P8_9CAUD|nr:hypothetical protein UFOVP1655_190 [uncultured Caudovirales phage]